MISKNRINRNLKPTTKTRRGGSKSSQSEFGYPLGSAEIPGYFLSLLTTSLLVGLGTTGSRIVQLMMESIHTMCGRHPSSLESVLIDAATEKPGMETLNHISLSVNGCGSDPNEGLQLLYQHWLRIVHCVTQLVLQLDHTDDQLAAKKSTKEVLTVWVISGNGGSSGGFQQPMIDLLHAVANRLSITTLRINLVMLGPEMSVRDVNRSVSYEQLLVLRQTTADNLTRVLGDHHSSESLFIPVPQEEGFFIPRSQRVWRTLYVDQSNGQHDFATIDSYIDMIASHLLGSILTPFGEAVEDRFIDLDRLHSNLRGAITREQQLT